jgi:hypothetical protein
MEEQMERLLDDNGYTFADDGSSYSRRCSQCQEVPCVWEHNQQAMIEFDRAKSKDDEDPNRRRFALYRQMALIINGGPSGRGNRLKLPPCVLFGVRALFPDPESVYTGHRELE